MVPALNSMFLMTGVSGSNLMYSSCFPGNSVWGYSVYHLLHHFFKERDQLNFTISMKQPAVILNHWIKFFSFKIVDPLFSISNIVILYLSTEWVDYVEKPMKYQALRPHFFSVVGGWRVLGVGEWVLVGWVMG